MNRKERLRHRISQKKYVKKLQRLGIKRSRRNRTEQNRRWIKRGINKLKHRCHSLVYEAIKKERLQKLPCSVCANNKAYAHHEDYSKPLDVKWLCPKHHVEEHRKKGGG